MKHYFSMGDNNKNHPLVYTLSHSKNFNHEEIQNLKQKPQNTLIVINKNTTEESCEKLIKEIKKLDIFFLIPQNLKQFFLLTNLNFVVYPVRPSEIINLKIINKSKNYNNFNLFLGSDGVLTNKENNETVYLTETEASIISLLFDKVIVERVLIKEKILNLRENIDTKSLDSHLSRIRKKMRKIDTTAQVTSINHNKIKIDLPS